MDLFCNLFIFLLREAVLQLEEELIGSELDIPVYFAEVCEVTAF